MASNLKPDVVLLLTDEQREHIKPLRERQSNLMRSESAGMILGSVGSDGQTVGLSYIPRKLAQEIIAIATREMGGKEDVSS